VLRDVILTSIFVTDLNAAYEFYCDKLGFRLLSLRKSRPAYMVVSPRGAKSAIAVIETHLKLPAEELSAEELWDAPPVLALSTDDIVADFRRLQEKGVMSFAHEPRSVEEYSAEAAQPRVIETTFSDPDLNRILLRQQLEEGDPGPFEYVPMWGF